MPVDTAGNVSRPPSPLPVTGQDADAPQVNVPIDDIYAILNMLPFLDGRKPMRGSQNYNGYKVTGAANATDPQDYVTLSQMQAAIASASGGRTGSLMIMTGTQAEPDTVVANGQVLSRVTFLDLWVYAQGSGNLAASEGAKTAGQYGPGDGSTTFSVPNLYADGGYFIRPMSSGRGIGTVQTDDLKGHTHSGTTGGGGSHSHSVPGVWTGTTSRQGGAGVDTAASLSSVTTSVAPDHTHPFTTESTGGTETRPKNIAYPVLIKT